MTFTTQSDWRKELDRREINGARAPLFVIAATTTVVAYSTDPYLAMASPVEFWSVLFFRFLLTMLGMIGVYAFWVGFVPPGWLAVFPGYRSGTGSAKAAQKNRDDKKAAVAKAKEKRRRPHDDEDEEEVMPA